MLKYADKAFAAKSATLWTDDPGPVHHIADSGNSVFRMRLNGNDAVLRLSDPAYRTFDEVVAELEFVRHLDRNEVAVSAPQAALSGRYAEEVTTGGMTMIASVFSWAPGLHVTPEMPVWNERFLRAWGRSLGTIHRAALSFVPSDTARRWQWSEEIFFRNAVSYIPLWDTASLRELDYLMNWLHRQRTDKDIYGMTHADFAPQNFRYDPDGKLTAFDFGNCCYHWYVSDLAISLSVLRPAPKSDRNTWRRWIVAAYSDVFDIDPYLYNNLDIFLRLRILYVYLSRLMKFGPAPNAEEQTTLATLRTYVHERYRW